MQRCVVMTHKNLLSFCFWRCRLTNEAVVTYCVITFAHHVTCSWNWRPGGVGQWLIIRTNSEKKDTNICSTPNKWKKGTSVECSRLNEKLKRITSLYVTHLKSSARSVHETVHPHISFQPSIMTRMRSPNANGNNKNTKEMKHCWEHAVSDRISEGKKKCRRHTLTHNSQWYASGTVPNILCMPTAGKTVMNRSEMKRLSNFPLTTGVRSADVEVSWTTV